MDALLGAKEQEVSLGRAVVMLQTPHIRKESLIMVSTGKQEISCVAPKADQIFSVDLQTINHVFLQNILKWPLSLAMFLNTVCERKKSCIKAMKLKVFCNKQVRHPVVQTTNKLTINMSLLTPVPLMLLPLFLYSVLFLFFRSYCHIFATA